MDNSEKLATWYTRLRKIKQKHDAISVGNHYTQPNTKNVN